MTTDLGASSVTELLRLAGADNQAAWQEIVRRYRGVVLARVRLFRLQDADVHDAVQMTWLRLVENRHRIQFPEHLGSWLVTTTTRECLSILRAATRRNNQDGTAIDNVADPASGPEQHVIDKDTMQTIHNLVAELAPREQAVLRALFSDQPPSYAHLARITGIPPGSLGPTRARALRKLHQKLETSPSSAAWLTHKTGSTAACLQVVGSCIALIRTNESPGPFRAVNACVPPVRDVPDPAT